VLRSPWRFLAQLVNAAIARSSASPCSRPRWSVYEILEATLSLVLSTLFLTACFTFGFFSRTLGRWLADGAALRGPDLPVLPVTLSRMLPVVAALTRGPRPPPKLHRSRRRID